MLKHVPFAFIEPEAFHLIAQLYKRPLARKTDPGPEIEPPLAPDETAKWFGPWTALIRQRQPNPTG